MKGFTASTSFYCDFLPLRLLKCYFINTSKDQQIHDILNDYYCIRKASHDWMQICNISIEWI